MNVFPVAKRWRCVPSRKLDDRVPTGADSPRLCFKVQVAGVLIAFDRLEERILQRVLMFR